MKQKRERKVLSFVLSFAMVIGMLTGFVPGNMKVAKADGSTDWSTNNSLPTSGNPTITAKVTTSGATEDYTDFSDALTDWSTASGSALTICDNITTYSTITVPSGERTLDLNGYGIKYTGSGDASVLTVPADASLTLADSRPTETTHYFSVADSPAGLATNISDTNSGSQQSFAGGYISGGKANGDGILSTGGGVQINGGTFKLQGGTIIGNTSSWDGAGVHLNTNDSAFEMSGGAIKYNATSDGWGGGLSVGYNSGNHGTGIVKLSGGEITNNRSNRASGNQNGGGIDLQNGTLELSGNIKITGNSPNNLSMLSSNHNVKIVGTLSSDALIGVAVSDDGTNYVDGVFTNSAPTTYNDATKFTSDNEEYVVGKNVDGQLLLREPVPANVTAVPNAKNLTYNGTAQELVAAGLAENGTMYYALGENADTAPDFDGLSESADKKWSIDIPTGTDAGTYYVWYKAVGDGGADTEPVCITVTIKQRSYTPYVPYVPASPTPSPTPAPTTAPSAAAPATEAYTVPVSNENTVDISVNISEGNAVVQEITQADLDKITDTSSGSGSGEGQKTDNDTVSIDVSGAKSEVTSVEFSGTTVEKLAKTVKENEKVDSLEIKMTNATVELDSAALSAVSEQKEGDTVKLVVENTEQTKLNETQKESLQKFSYVQTFEAYFESAGKKIHDFKDGKATVSIKFTPGSEVQKKTLFKANRKTAFPFLTASAAVRDVKYYHVYYVPENGLLERYTTWYADGMLSFITTHFSDYAIVYDETMENATGKEEVTPSPSPSASPSAVPSALPSQAPSASAEPSVAPSASAEPSAVPSQTPSEEKTGPVTAQEQAQAALDINAGLKVVHNGTSATVQWGKVDGAKYYKVYAAYCGSKYKLVKTVNAAAKCRVTIKKLNGKKLSTTKNIKVYVAAYCTLETKNGTTVTKKDVRIAKTIAGHVVGKKNKKYSNAKKIKLSKTSYTLKKGKTAKIKAKTVLQYPKKKQLSDAHAKEFRYATSNKSIATVSKTGKITAKKKGSCVIYVYARNGLAKKVKVAVK